MSKFIKLTNEVGMTLFLNISEIKVIIPQDISILKYRTSIVTKSDLVYTVMETQDYIFSGQAYLKNIL